VVAVRVRASVGRPGASAQHEYRRRRAAERAHWTHNLPWRAGAVLAAAVAAGLLGAFVGPDLAGLLAVVAAAGLGWRLRYRPSPDTLAWRRGAAGERRTARLLAPLERRGWAVLHDLAIPGTPANLDHLVIGPGGVLVIDSKQYRGRLRLDGYGMVWHGRHLLVSALRKVLWQADQADEVLGVADVQVAAIIAVHGAAVPGGLLQAEGVTIVPARRVPDLLQALPPMLGPERVAWLADRARLRFHPAA
jgi:Nuclease-related domain